MKVNKTGKPTNWYVEQQIQEGVWHEETIPAEVVGLTRPLTVLRSERKTQLITHDWHGDTKTFCPPMWWDLGIGSGACGLGCRSCFLMLTFRAMRDPRKHLLYTNISDFTHASERWLKEPTRRRQHTLGVGIDRSDSLLYEGVTQQVQQLAPIFSNSTHNPLGNKLVLLTKSANTHYLAGIPYEQRKNIIVTFSLNPEYIADMWEGKWPDTGERITPSIERRLDAVLYAQELGYEVRVRLDPILTPDGWEDHYAAFIDTLHTRGIAFRYCTLGTYREKNQQLDGWRERWGLLPMEWHPSEEDLVQDGTHRHLAEHTRISIYRTVSDLIRSAFPQARISLCKETHTVRKALNFCNADCNCLI